MYIYISIGVFLLFIIIGGVGFLTSDAQYKGKIAYGVSIAGINISGKSQQDAQNILEHAGNRFMNNEIQFTVDDKTWSFRPDEIGIELNTNKSIIEAMDIGRTGSTLKQRVERIQIFFNKQNLSVSGDYNHEELASFFGSFHEIEKEPRSATMDIIDNQLIITPSESGKIIQKNIAEKQLQKKIGQLDLRTIDLVVMHPPAEIDETETILARQLVNKVDRQDITLQYKEKEYRIRSSDLKSWIGFTSLSVASLAERSYAQFASRFSQPSVASFSGTALAHSRKPQVKGIATTDSQASTDDEEETRLKEERDTRDRIILADQSDSERDAMWDQLEALAQSNVHRRASTFITSVLDPQSLPEESNVLLPQLDPNKAVDFFNEINEELGTQPKNARFHVVDDQLETLEKSEDGIGVDLDKTLANIADAISQGKGVATLEMVVIPAAVTEEKINELGISELIGKGTSSFGGSSSSRVHNISLGASRFHGLLVAPGEELSAGKTIGTVDKAHGFVPELVILQDKTVPQDGGGLCQVATTLFRATMDAGLEITKRRNHSYAVSYYSPQGTDATIYYPSTDFKFRNDTENYLLIQTFVQGRTLTFEIYGTPDGRRVEVGTPETYQRNPDGSSKSRWTRQVMDAEGNLIHDDVFNSFYKPANQFPTDKQREEEKKKREEEEKKKEEERKKNTTPPPSTPPKEPEKPPTNPPTNPNPPQKQPT